MILVALAAAAVAGPPTQAAPMPNLYHQPAHCGPVVAQEVARQTVALKGRRANGLQYAVLRELEGCAVPAPVGYHPTSEPGAADAASGEARREDAPSNRR